jgi:hypothetical protein
MGHCYLLARYIFLDCSRLLTPGHLRLPEIRQKKRTGLLSVRLFFSSRLHREQDSRAGQFPKLVQVYTSKQGAVKEFMRDIRNSDFEGWKVLNSKLPAGNFPPGWRLAGEESRWTGRGFKKNIRKKYPKKILTNPCLQIYHFY